MTPVSEPSCRCLGIGGERGCWLWNWAGFLLQNQLFVFNCPVTDTNLSFVLSAEMTLVSEPSCLGIGPLGDREGVPGVEQDSALVAKSVICISLPNQQK